MKCIKGRLQCYCSEIFELFLSTRWHQHLRLWQSPFHSWERPSPDFVMEKSVLCTNMVSKISWWILNRCVLFPNEFSYWKRSNWIENINNFEFKINKDDIFSCCSSDNFNISRSDFLFCYGVVAEWCLPDQFCRMSLLFLIKCWDTLSLDWQSVDSSS